MSDIMADDENTAKAPSYTVVGLNTGYKFNYGNWGMDVFGRVDNLFDKEYVGSVIVNESNVITSLHQAETMASGCRSLIASSKQKEKFIL